jgi:hypothetical protein
MRFGRMFAVLLTSAIGTFSHTALGADQLSLQLLASPPFQLSFSSIEPLLDEKEKDPAKSTRGFKVTGKFKSNNGEVLFVKYPVGKSMRTRKLEAQSGAESAPFTLEVESPKYPMTLEFFTSRNELKTKSSSAQVQVISKPAPTPCPAEPDPINALIEPVPPKAPSKTQSVFILRTPESRIQFVCSEANPGVVKGMLEIQGALSVPHWTLVSDTGEKLPLVPTEGDLGFRFEVPIEKDGGTFELMAVGPKGEVSSSKFKVKISDPEAFQLAREGKRRSPFSWSFGAGLSFITYEQGSTVNLSQKSLTVKAAADYALNKRWVLGANVYTNIVTLSSSMGATSARFLGANLRANFDPKLVSSPSRLLLGGGFFLSSMTVKDNLFGFKTFLSAHAYPSYTYTLKDGSVIGSYFKLVPISSSFFTLSFLSREIALGASYTTRKIKSNRYSVSVDYSNLLIRSPGLSRTYLQTFSVGLGMAF